MSNLNALGSRSVRILIPVISAVLGLPLLAQSNRLQWSELRELSDLTELESALTEAATADPDLRLNATSLAYRSALFLATGSADTPQHGSKQRIEATYLDGGDPAHGGRAVVSVQFLGLRNRAGRHGERFEIELAAGIGKTWDVRGVRQAWCRQRPIPARPPDSGTFRDFLDTVRQGRAGSEYEHRRFAAPVRISIVDDDVVDPVDPVVLRLLGAGIIWDGAPVPQAELSAKLGEYRQICELVDVEPKVVIGATADVTFEAGLGLLAAVSNAGIREVFLPAPRPPHPGGHERLPPPPTKPTPPAEFFKRR